MAHRSPAELEEERLLIQAAQRDRAAFGPLYERYVDQIYAYCYSLTKSRELAEDVTAATFARAMEDLPRFEWRGLPYSAWLYRVAAHLVARDRRRPGWIELNGDVASPDATDPAEAVQRMDRDAQLRAVVATLPDDQRQVILLRYGGELSNREIAEIMGRSEGAVKLLCFRAVTALRSHLGAPLPAERDINSTRSSS